MAAPKDSRLRARHVPMYEAVASCWTASFSPIELAFAKLKQAWRRVGARTKETLIDAIAATLDTVTTVEARAFFTHCGYRLTPDWDHLLSTLLWYPQGFHPWFWT